MNSWSFVGNLGAAAEQKFLPSGESITLFSVGVSSGFGEKKATTWTRCSMFGRRGDAVLPFLAKGAKVGVVGEATLREWTDKEGAKRSSLEVRVNDLTLLSPKQDQQTRPAQQQSESDADIPF